MSFAIMFFKVFCLMIFIGLLRFYLETKNLSAFKNLRVSEFCAEISLQAFSATFTFVLVYYMFLLAFKIILC